MPARRLRGVDAQLGKSAEPVDQLEQDLRAKEPDLDAIIATANMLFRRRIAARPTHVRLLGLLATALQARNHPGDSQEAEECLAIAMDIAVEMKVPALIIPIAARLALAYHQNDKPKLARDLVRRMLRDYPWCADNARFHLSRCTVEGIAV